MGDENYAEVVQQIAANKEKIDSIARVQEDISERLDSKEIREALELVAELNGFISGNRRTGTLGLKSIVYGSKALGVKPIRETMEDFAKDLGIVMTTHARMKWIIGILSLTSVSGVIGWVLFLRELAGAP